MGWRVGVGRWGAGGVEERWYQPHDTGTSAKPLVSKFDA